MHHPMDTHNIMCTRPTQQMRMVETDYSNGQTDQISKSGKQTYFLTHSEEMAVMVSIRYGMRISLFPRQGSQVKNLAQMHK